MILEFVQGAVQQIGRFIGGIPSAFGWSGQGGAVSPGGLVCGSVTVQPSVSGKVFAFARVSGTVAVFPRVGGLAQVESC